MKNKTIIEIFANNMTKNIYKQLIQLNKKKASNPIKKLA